MSDYKQTVIGAVEWLAGPGADTAKFLAMMTEMGFSFTAPMHRDEIVEFKRMVKAAPAEERERM